MVGSVRLDERRSALLEGDPAGRPFDVGDVGQMLHQRLELVSWYPGHCEGRLLESSTRSSSVTIPPPKAAGPVTSGGGCASHRRPVMIVSLPRGIARRFRMAPRLDCRQAACSGRARHRATLTTGAAPFPLNDKDYR